MILTSDITSLRGLPLDCSTASGIKGSVNDVEATLPLSEDVVLVFGDVAELFIKLHWIPKGLTRYCFMPIIWKEKNGKR